MANHPLPAFFAAAYGISWSLWLVAFLAGDNAAGRTIFLLGAFGPAIAAALVTRVIGESVPGWLHNIFRLRVGGRFWLFALGLPALVYAVVNLELELLGEPVDATLLPDRLGGYLTTLVFVTFLGGGQEEPGWRGFALPRLQQDHTPVRATLILGLLWGIWHVPLYGPLGFVVPLLLAFFYTYLFNRTGSVAPCMLLHGGFTAAQDHLTLLEEEAHGVTDLAIGLAYIAGVLLLVGLTRGRLGRASKEPERDRAEADR